jgi:NTP pyrophosphatase (non-canonical NTP hydrolase)
MLRSLCEYYEIVCEYVKWWDNRKGDATLRQQRVQLGDGLGDVASHVNRLHAQGVDGLHVSLAIVQESRLGREWASRHLGACAD